MSLPKLSFADHLTFGAPFPVAALSGVAFHFGYAKFGWFLAGAAALAYLGLTALFLVGNYMGSRPPTERMPWYLLPGVAVFFPFGVAYVALTSCLLRRARATDRTCYGKGERNGAAGSEQSFDMGDVDS